MNVIPFPVPGNSVDESMAYLNDLHARGELKDLLVVGSDKEGHYVFASTQMCAKDMLFKATYLHERVMNLLRANGVMPIA